MTTEARFRQASREDEPMLRALLAAASLPTDDVSTEAQEYLLAYRGAELLGCIGLERAGDDALLRSFAVRQDSRRCGLGTLLFERLLALAALRGFQHGYVLTTTAERFCLSHGFERIERTEVPSAVAALAQFRSLCPAAAACFRRRLDRSAVHFPVDVLRTRPDVAGARMWAVGLERAMLSYFELEPRTRFERHAHAAEQITLVLEGEIVFEVEGRGVVRVGAGEVIALPSGVPHAAWTEALPARAVDAWSPPRRDLLG